MSATEHTTGLAIATAHAAADKKTEHLAAIDASEQLELTDALLLASGTNDCRIYAIVDAVDGAMHRAGARRHTREGFADAHWVLVDYGDVVVHVLQNEDREFYSLKRLWEDCPVVELSADLAHEGSQDGDFLGGRKTTTSWRISLYDATARPTTTIKGTFKAGSTSLSMRPIMIRPGTPPRTSRPWGSLASSPPR